MLTWPRGKLVPAMLLSAALVGCASQAAPAPTFQTVQVKRGNITTTVSAAGAIALSLMANISPEAGSTSSSAKVKTVDVTVGQQVTAGQQVAQLQTDDLSNQLEQTKINLSIAQSKLDALLNPDTTSLNNQVLQGKINLASAQTKLIATQHPYTDADIANQQNTVASDQMSLKAAQLSMDATKVSPQNTADISAQEDQVIYWTNNYITSKQAFDKNQENQDKLNSDYKSMIDAQAALQALKDKAESANTSAQQALSNAQAALQKDQAQLALMQAGPKATDLQLAQQQLQLAQQSYDAAQQSLARAVAPNDIKQAQGNVALSQAAVNLAQHALDAATLKAPFAGTVVALGASPGDSVTAATVIVTIADLSKAEVDINVNQLDIGKVELGQPANISVVSFPGRKFTGKVSTIASSATNSQGVVTYGVTVAVDNSGNVLKPGMTATANIVIENLPNVLTVPTTAVQTAGGRSFAIIPPDLHRQPIEIGSSDGLQTAVTSGLTEGESVAILVAGNRASGTARGSAAPGGIGGIRLPGISLPGGGPGR